ncbi:16S rRNA (guanine(966)-N(2))-methyltransferase RsmD [Candidatus Acetothermia bacterium]|nr:MAG: 16S rRNA (guanine(966)-N(2))-methyltransferase RsmD [Candidatus Acetothermia bacterium]
MGRYERSRSDVVRIIGGTRRGRKLVDWEGEGIRPVRDFVRSALFSIIADFVPDAAFLDLYCGTGSIGLEALSRGARSCTFVDRSHAACSIVRQNLDALDLLSAGEVIESGVVETIDHLKRRGRRFDIAFIDPPYHEGLVPRTLEALADGLILTPDPVVIAAVDRKEEIEGLFGVLIRVDERVYGDNRLIFYRR